MFGNYASMPMIATISPRGQWTLWLHRYITDRQYYINLLCDNILQFRFTTTVMSLIMSCQSIPNRFDWLLSLHVVLKCRLHLDRPPFRRNPLSHGQLQRIIWSGVYISDMTVSPDIYIAEFQVSREHQTSDSNNNCLTLVTAGYRYNTSYLLPSS